MRPDTRLGRKNQISNEKQNRTKGGWHSNLNTPPPRKKHFKICIGLTARLSSSVHQYFTYQATNHATRKSYAAGRPSLPCSRALENRRRASTLASKVRICTVKQVGDQRRETLLDQRWQQGSSNRHTLHGTMATKHIAPDNVHRGATNSLEGGASCAERRKSAVPAKEPQDLWWRTNGNAQKKQFDSCLEIKYFFAEDIKKRLNDELQRILRCYSLFWFLFWVQSHVSFSQHSCCGLSPPDFLYHSLPQIVWCYRCHP